jgi:hypothetical protein
MATKVHIPFEMHYPLRHEVIRNLRFVTEHEGDLIIKGSAALDPTIAPLSPGKRISVSIGSVEYNGVDILPVLHVFDVYSDIEAYAEKKAPQFFQQNERRTA